MAIQIILYLLLKKAALKSEEIDDKLIDAQIKMGKLKASGANQSALDDQQAVIDNLIAQKNWYYSGYI